MKGKENLKPPFRTPEEAREKGRNGGKKSGEARRKKALLSQIYGELLAEKHALGKGKNIKGVIKEVLKKGGAPAVSMIKEMREATEGSKLLIDTPTAVKIIIEGDEPNADNT